MYSYTYVCIEVKLLRFEIEYHGNTKQSGIFQQPKIKKMVKGEKKEVVGHQTKLYSEIWIIFWKKSIHFSYFKKFQ